MTQAQLQESFWVLRAQVGDREALDSLLRSIQQPVYSYLKNMIQDTVTAEDTLQEVFLLIVRKIKNLREPSLFRPWVYRIAYRQAIKVLRREKRWRKKEVGSQLLEAHRAKPITSLEDTLELANIKNSLLQLSPPVRAVIALHYLQELTIREVGDVLGLPVGTVKSRLAYGLQILRAHLKPESRSD